jgi:Holliday junction resolvase
MSLHSKNKGKRGERAWRDELNNNGFAGSKRDGQQGSGGSAEHPDVVAPMMPGTHWEVKSTEKLNVRQAMQQAIDDSAGSGKRPVVAWKKNHAGWLVVMRAEDWFALAHSGSAAL